MCIRLRCPGDCRAFVYVGVHTNQPHPHPDNLFSFIKDVNAFICYAIRYFNLEHV